SDDTFRRFYKLDNILQTDRVNSAFIVGQSDRNYFSATLYHFGGLMLLQDTPNSEGRVHPVIDYNYIFADPVLGRELRLNANALSFSKDLTFVDGATVTRFANYNMTRVVADLGWRRRLIDGVGQTFTPFADVRGDFYTYSDVVDPTTKLLLPDETITRGVATAGLMYSYPFVASMAGASHVVEPVAQIITRQKSIDQRRLPDEDARSINFDDTNLFDFDKFSGYDRIETGTRV